LACVDARHETYQYELTRQLDKAEESLNAECLAGHLQDDAILAHIDDSRAELVREHMRSASLRVSSFAPSTAGDVVGDDEERISNLMTMLP
jgi:hypothetical protein